MLCLHTLKGLHVLSPLILTDSVFQFSVLRAQDTTYSPLLFQILEDCWQQDHFLRPSAEQLHNTIKELTSLTLAENQLAPPGGERAGILLDSFTVHTSHRVTASHCSSSQFGFDICTALRGTDETTAILHLQYNHRDDNSQLQINVRISYEHG